MMTKMTLTAGAMLAALALAGCGSETSPAKTSEKASATATSTATAQPAEAATIDPSLPPEEQYGKCLEQELENVSAQDTPEVAAADIMRICSEYEVNVRIAADDERGGARSSTMTAAMDGAMADAEKILIEEIKAKRAAR